MNSGMLYQDKQWHSTTALDAVICMILTDFKELHTLPMIHCMTSIM